MENWITKLSSQIKRDRRGYSFNSKAFLAGTNRTHNIGTSRRDGAPHAFTVRTTRRYPRKPHARILHAARVGRGTRHLRSDFDFDYRPRMVWRTWNVFRRADLAGWKKITSAVHAKGGRMFSQLWHVGRSPSVIPEYGQDSTPSVSTPSGWFKPCDGVELHAATGWLGNWPDTGCRFQGGRTHIVGHQRYNLCPSL
jgi:hypothetical protein